MVERKEVTMPQQSFENARVAVVGAGGVGSYFGARAALAGADVTLCLRRPRPEFVIRSGDEELRPTVRTVTDPADVGDVDWVLLGVKAHQTPGAANWLKALDRPGATDQPVAVVLQNGVHLPERLQGLWSGPILPTVVYAGVEMISPGVVEHRSYGFVEVQEGPLADRLAAVFGPGSKEVRPVPDFAKASWEKLLSNAAGNSITALTLRRLDVFAEPGIAELGYAVMQEATAVAVADGVRLPAEMPDLVQARMQQMPVGQGSSMLYDRLAGHELEHEALIGAVVQIGADHGVPTPASRILLSLLRAVSGRPLP
jgi:2-dehydropantoate 2-reductase